MKCTQGLGLKGDGLRVVLKELYSGVGVAALRKNW